MASGIGKLRQIAKQAGRAIYIQVWMVTRVEGPQCLAGGKTRITRTLLPKSAKPDKPPKAYLG